MINHRNDDRITRIKLSKVRLPLVHAFSDAKVFTGRQQPLQFVSLMFAEIDSAQGCSGLGFTYALRGGGDGQFAHACEIGPLIVGQDPNDIARIWNQLLWAGASVGRSGLAVQAIAAIDIALWDMKARRARLPLTKLIGSHREAVLCYNTSGGYLQAPIEEILKNADRSLERGIRGVKIKVGQPDMAADLKRVEALRRHVGADVPIMVDANQQWDRITALRFGRRVEGLNLTWIEEPLDAHDAEGHAALAAALDTPIATGEMLSSMAAHRDLIARRSVDILQPDAPRIGGITPFLRLADLADQAGLDLAPHFVMEIHIHLAACYHREPWVEHFEWLEPLFHERLKIHDGRIEVPDRPGLGLSLSEQMRQWTVEAVSIE